jgi:hypothetical protein
VPDGILVTLRSARRHSAVHPAATVRHCRRLARMTASGFGFGISMPGAKAIAWGCSSDFDRSPPSGVSTWPTMALPPAWTVTCSTRTVCWPLHTITVEGIEQHGIGPGKFVGLAQVLASPLEGLSPSRRSVKKSGSSVARARSWSRSVCFASSSWLSAKRGSRFMNISRRRDATHSEIAVGRIVAGAGNSKWGAGSLLTGAPSAYS